MTPQHRPLVLTTDAELLDQLLGMAAAAGVAVDVAVEPATCGPQWIDAPLVLLGAELAVAVTGAGLAPRAGLVLVTRATATPELSRLAGIVGAEEVIGLQGREDDLLERLADATESPARARVIGVLGGRGGAGASTLAAGLAIAAAGHGSSWLIDLDPIGGGADAGLGAELSSGARWSDLGALTGRLSPHTLRASLPQVEGVAVVAADGDTTTELRPEAVQAVVSAAGRSGGTTVLDLGRTATIARDVAVAAVDDLLLVVPAELRSVIAARQVADLLGPTAATPRIVVRLVPGALPSAEVARGLALSLAGELPDEVTVRAAIQMGEPAGLLRGTKLAALCEAILVEPAAIGMAA